MRPQDELNSLRAAFLNLFEDKTPDLSRFLRLVIDVLEPATYEGVCSGDGTLLPRGCGEQVTFRQAMNEHRRGIGYECPRCGCVYLFSLCKRPKKAPRRIVLTAERGNDIGGCRSESDSGVVIIDK